MKTSDKMIFVTATIAVAGLLMYVVSRHKKTNRILTEIADEGYETAHDILFPGQDNRKSKLQYGPVLPS